MFSAGLLAGCLLALSPVGAAAQVKCPEGKTASGDCVDPGLASSMRQAAIIFTQPKLSATAPPTLPVDDGTYRYPNQLINDLLSGPAQRCAVVVRSVCR